MNAITALSYVDICGSTICNLLLLRYFIVRCCAKKKLFFLSTDPKSLFPLFFLLHGIGDFIFAVLKVTSSERPLVGRDVSVTLVAVFLPVFCFCGLVLYYGVIINFLKGYSRIMKRERREKVDQKFAVLSRRCYLLIPMSFVPCILPLVGLGYPANAAIFGMAYLIGNGFLALCYGFLFNSALGFLLAELNTHLKERSGDSDDIKLVYDRLQLAYLIGSGAFVFIGFAYLIFGSWYILLRKSSYLFLIIQITTHPLFTILILTVSRISHTKILPQKIRSSVDDFLQIKSHPPSVEMKVDAFDDHDQRSNVSVVSEA